MLASCGADHKLPVKRVDLLLEVMALLGVKVLRLDLNPSALCSVVDGASLSLEPGVEEDIQVGVGF